MPVNQPAKAATAMAPGTRMTLEMNCRRSRLLACRGPARAAVVPGAARGGEEWPDGYGGTGTRSLVKPG